MAETELRGLGIPGAEDQSQGVVRSPFRDTMRRLFSNKLAIVGILMLGTVILVAFMAPWIASQHPDKNGIFQAFPQNNKLPPSMDHPMGTDVIGRDMLSLIIYGARISLLVGVFAVSLAIILGSTLGAIAGFAGGTVDNVIMRIMDIMISFPTILLALVIVVILGPGLFNAMVAVGIVSIPAFARITRASVLGESGKDYVMAARSIGAGARRVLWRHVMPNTLSPIIVAASLGIAAAILDAAALGFLGLGAQPPTPEWGLLLSRNRGYMFTSPWMVFFPGISIMFLVLGFNLLGDGLRDALDPKLG
ncbi:MAG: ABC transporter permease [Chloroflexi bacterium]|nr:ABC transporter permease [Chloroflexota bacterium]